MTSYNSIFTVAFLTLVSFCLSGCSVVNKEAVDCPQITALQEAAEVFVTTDNFGHLVDVRFNGVSTSCTKKRNGKIKMEVSAGVKAVRSYTGNGDADVAIIGMAMAIIGPDDKLVSNEAFGYRIGFNKGMKSQYPITEFGFVIEAGQRVVLMLTPTL